MAWEKWAGMVAAVLDIENMMTSESASLVHDRKMANGWVIGCCFACLWFYCVTEGAQTHTKQYYGNMDYAGKLGHFCHWDKWQKVAQFTLRTCKFKIHEMISHLPSTGQMLLESVYWERNNITLPPASLQHSSPYWPAWGWNNPKQQTETFPMFPTRFIPPEYIFPVWNLERVGVELATVKQNSFFSWLNQFPW